jgi:hypothetical protein
MVVLCPQPCQLFQCPFFFANFAFLNASEILLLLARACAASNSFFFVLYGARFLTAFLRFFLTPVVPASLRFFLFGPLGWPPLLKPTIARCAPAMGFPAFCSSTESARKFADRSSCVAPAVLATADARLRAVFGRAGGALTDRRVLTPLPSLCFGPPPVLRHSELQSSNLVGTIPNAIGAFVDMESFNVFGNRRLNGSLPASKLRAVH